MEDGAEVFSYEFRRFLRPELFFQCECLFFVSGIVEHGAESLSYEFIRFLRPELFFQ